MFSSSTCISHVLFSVKRGHASHTPSFLPSVQRVEVERKPADLSTPIAKVGEVGDGDGGGGG